MSRDAGLAERILSDLWRDEDVLADEDGDGVRGRSFSGRWLRRTCAVVRSAADLLLYGCELLGPVSSRVSRQGICFGMRGVGVKSAALADPHQLCISVASPFDVGP